MSTATMHETESLVKIEEGGLPSVYLEGNPTEVLAEAHRAAKALQGVLDAKPRKLIFNKKRYLESEDWVTLARFYGITGAAIGDPEYVSFDTGQTELVRGFKATFVALRAGVEISRATAYCMSDEEKWGSRSKYEYHIVLKNGAVKAEADAGPKSGWIWDEEDGKRRPRKERVLVGEEKVPLYQLASMAQTRAMSKVLAQVLKWVVVLAGYAPTPAEEMSDVPGAHVEDAEIMPREPGSDDGPTVETSVGQVKVGSGEHAEAAGAKDYKRAPAKTGTGQACPECHKPSTPAKYPAPGKELFCSSCKHVFGATK